MNENVLRRLKAKRAYFDKYKKEGEVNITELSEEIEIPRTTLSTWVNTYSWEEEAKYRIGDVEKPEREEENKSIFKSKRYRSDYHPMKILELKSLGIGDVTCAMELGVSPSALYKWRQNHDEFREAYEAGLALDIESVESRMRETAMGETLVDKKIKKEQSKKKGVITFEKTTEEETIKNNSGNSKALEKYLIAKDKKGSDFDPNKPKETEEQKKREVLGEMSDDELRKKLERLQEEMKNYV